MLRLILNTPASDLQAWSGFDFAVIELTIPRIERWIDLMDEATKQQIQYEGFFATEYWDCTPAYCTNSNHDFSELFGDAWDARYESEGWNLEPESFAPPFYMEQRSETERIKVMPSEVWWMAYPKHGDVPITTPPLRRDDMYAFLRRLRGKHMES